MKRSKYNYLVPLANRPLLTGEICVQRQSDGYAITVFPQKSYLKPYQYTNAVFVSIEEAQRYLDYEAEKWHWLKAMER